MQLAYSHKYLLLPDLSLQEQSQQIQKWSIKSRQHGLLSLEQEEGVALDPFTEKGLAMLN